MNRQQLRESLRSKIGDMSTDPLKQWYSDSNLNVRLLQSAYHVQDDINGIDPYPYTRLAYNNLVSGVTGYAYPSWMRSPGVHSIHMKTATSAYYRLTKIDLDSILKAYTGDAAGIPVTPSSTVGYWAPDGPEILLYPSVTANVTAGLRIRAAAYVTLDTDATIPGLPLSVHDCIVYQACLDIGLDTDSNNMKVYSDLYGALMTSYKNQFKPSMGSEVEQVTAVGGNDRISWPRG